MTATGVTVPIRDYLPGHLVDPFFFYSSTCLLQKSDDWQKRTIHPENCGQFSVRDMINEGGTVSEEDKLGNEGVGAPVIFFAVFLV